MRFSLKRCDLPSADDGVRFWRLSPCSAYGFSCVNPALHPTRPSPTPRQAALWGVGLDRNRLDLRGDGAGEAELGDLACEGFGLLLGRTPVEVVRSPPHHG